MEQQKVDLDALKAKLAKATPGPWRRGSRHEYVVVHLDHGYIVCDEDPDDDNAERVEADTDIIIATHNALPALIAELRELRARVTPEVIREKHKDGNWWLVWSPLGNQWYKALWHNGHWEMTGRLGLFNKATHALPLPPEPEGPMRPPLTLEQQRQLVQTRRTATLATLSLIRVGSTPQDLHERIRAAELECGLWVDAVERLRRMEAAG